MSKFRLGVTASLFLFAASAAFSQESAVFDPEACAKHCREMAAAQTKGAETREALMKQREAAWKEIEAQLQLARTSRGDKKVAALETAIEKLVAYHASTPAGMADCPMMGGHAVRVGLLRRAHEARRRRGNEGLLHRSDEGMLRGEHACSK